MTYLANPHAWKGIHFCLLDFVHQFNRRKDWDKSCTEQRWSLLGRSEADVT